jgi:hypothetical protein
MAATGNPVNAPAKSAEIDGVDQNAPAILITEDPLDDNWFSHEYRHSSVITLADWEVHYAPPSLKTYIIYQIAQAVVSFSGDLSEEMLLNLVHEPPVGCMFDFSVHKPDIRYGMVAGNLCTRCAGQLRTLGVQQDAIDAVRRILDLVRAEAVGEPLLLDPTHAFVVMRFTDNDENDNAWKYGIKAGLEAAGFQAVRADNRVESGQILEKIVKQISKSRLVVVKVDENSLNVYFELGLAMGINKDILLVSESSLVLNLPSDLRNWECLTYTRGDYCQLMERVQHYVANAYGTEVGFGGSIGEAERELARH